MWWVVKGKGDYRQKPFKGEGKTLQSVCGQFLIPIHPVMPIVLEHHPEVCCKKCVRII